MVFLTGFAPLEGPIASIKLLRGTLKLGKLYELIIREGIAADPRGKRTVQEKLLDAKREYRKSKGKLLEFDLDKLINPYPDTRILYGDKNLEIKDILVGIDVETQEILLADRLRRGKRIDLIISHHPQGKALAGLYEVMEMQVELLKKIGIPKDVASHFLEKRIKEVQRKILSQNHLRAVDAARLLDIPFMCAHTASDNFVSRYLQDLIVKTRFQTLEDIIKLLKSIPEYKEALKSLAGPRIILGEPKDKAGKVLVEMTGGTEGSKEIFGRLSQAGIKTIVTMHLSEEHFQKVKPERINVIVAGHTASDSLGMNLLLDRIQARAREELEILCCSGFRRIKRS